MFRNKLVVATAYFIFLSTPLIGHSQESPLVVDAQFHTAYVPKGFDTNDNVQIVAEGTFPNTCYKPADVKVSIDHEKKEIRLIPQAYKYSGVCLQMLVYWHKEIELGLLRAGQYTILTDAGQNTSKILGTLPIGLTLKSEPDDFLYASVRQVFLQQEKGGKNFIIVAGEYPSRCVHMEKVVVNVQPRVIVIQPITKEVDGGEVGCEVYKSIPFQERVEVPELVKGRYLIHIRSLSGRGMNNLVDVE